MRRKIYIFCAVIAAFSLLSGCTKKTQDQQKTVQSITASSNTQAIPKQTEKPQNAPESVDEEKLDASSVMAEKGEILCDIPEGISAETEWNGSSCAALKQGQRIFCVTANAENNQCVVTLSDSENMGESWSENYLILTQPEMIDDNVYSLSMWSPNEGRLLISNSEGNTYCYATQDGGKTWAEAAHIERHLTHVIAGGFTGPDFGVICYQYRGETNQPDIAVSYDGGMEWAPLKLEVPDLEQYDYAECGAPYLEDENIILPVQVRKNFAMEQSELQYRFQSKDQGKTWTVLKAD